MTQQVQETAKVNGTAKGSEEEGFLEFETDIPTFKPEMSREIDKKNPKRENYTGKPVQGYVLACEILKIRDPKTQQTKEQSLYTIHLTKPTTGVYRDDQPGDIPAGKTIKVWGNAQIKQFLSPQVANHPTAMVEVRIQPLYREPIPGEDKKMWHFKLGVKQPQARKSLALSGTAIMARLEATAPKQIASAGAITVEGSVADDDLPF